MSGYNIGFVIFPNLTQLDFTGPLRSRFVAYVLLACAGAVNSASSTTYSQLPTNSRFETMKAAPALSRPPKLATTTGSFTFMPADLPRGSGLALSGEIACNRPKPVSWS